VGESLRSTCQCSNLYMKAKYFGREDIIFPHGKMVAMLGSGTGRPAGNSPAGSVWRRARCLQGDVLSSCGKLHGALPVGSGPR